MRKNGAMFALFLLVGTGMYGLFQARTLIDGPKLSVSTPYNGGTISEPVFEVKGSTKNATHVRINGKDITMETNGNFSEKLATPSGYGSIVIEATNRFGQHTEERIDFLGDPQHS